MEEAIRSVEEKEGIRFIWNAFPNTKNESVKNVLPVACLYKPMHGHSNNSLLHVNYSPVTCEKIECGGVISPYCSVDFGTKHWKCLFCGRMNLLPPQYRNITPDSLPYELFNEHSTLFYRIPRPDLAGRGRTYLFVIDACSFDLERHLMLKKGLIKTLENIPEDCFIGVIRYSSNIEVFSLENEGVNKMHVFPVVNYSLATLQKAVRVENKLGSPLSIFVKRKRECQEYVKQIFKTLSPNTFPVPVFERPKRSTGSALELASSIIQGVCAEGSGHLLLFTHGPCTYGPGSIAPHSLKDPLRNRSKGIAKLFLKESLYDRLSVQMGKKRHVIDIIAMGIDDFGFAEMRSLTEKTGGIVVFARDFSEEIYYESIDRMFKRHQTEEDLPDQPMKRVFDVRTTVKVSRGYVARSAIGPGISQNDDKKTPFIWRQGSVFDRTTIGIVFEHLEDQTPGAPLYIQIRTEFTDSNETVYNRITTIARSFINAMDLSQVIGGFDQEAACVFKAKELSVNADNGDGVDVIRQADRCLIRFMQKFCMFDKDIPSSIKVPQMMSFFPEFMFFLRRLPALHTDGLSLDEVAYQRTILLSEDSSSTMCIIRPSLTAFHYTGERTPVELDSRSLKPDVCLLLDTFHDVLIWNGENIDAWLKSGIEDNPDYWYFKEMRATIHKEAAALRANRLPVPKFTECNQYSSQERILLCKVNPSSSVANSNIGEGQTIVTEDIDFSRFYEYLIRLVVSS
ncbi:protein transport protein SEC23 [Nematocida sp. AWRm80]|nr:protein transport protein SEC23 [Nematocida sp. AWRm80]